MVFFSRPWKRIVKSSPSVRPWGPCDSGPHYKETPLQTSIKTTGLQRAAGHLAETLATGSHSTSVEANIWQVIWQVFNLCGNSRLSVWVKCVRLKGQKKIKDVGYKANISAEVAQTGWAVHSSWTSSPAERAARLGEAFHLPPQRKWTTLGRALTVCWLGLFINLTDLVFLDVGRPEGWIGFLVFCLATQMVENSSVEGFAWRGNCLIWSSPLKDEQTSLAGESPRPLEITQALKSICEKYKQQSVLIYSILFYNMYLMAANPHFEKSWCLGYSTQN